MAQYADVRPGDWFVADAPGREHRWEQLITRLRGQPPARWSVAGIAVTWAGGQLYTVEAARSGARLTEWAWGARPHAWSTGTGFSGGRLAADAAMRHAGHGPRCRTGARCSWRDYATLALHARGVSWPWLRRRISGTASMTGAQLTDRACADAGVRLFDDGRLSGDVTAGDLGGLLDDGCRARLRGVA